MSNINLAAWAAILEDPRKIALVNLLTEKTKEGKVPWVKKRNAVTSNLQGSLEVNFVMQASLFGARPSWQLFTVRDARGNELLRVAPAPISIFALTNPLPVPGEGPSLTQAVDHLFEAVSSFTGDDLDGAISTIKNL